MKPYFETNSGKLYNCDVLEGLKQLPAESIDCCVTSPPYWGLRDYGTAKWEGGIEKCDHSKISSRKESLSSTLGGTNPNGNHAKKGWKGGICEHCGARRIDNQLGLEKTPEEYVKKMVVLFGEVKRVLKKEGTFWLNLGDSYNGSGGDHKQEEGYNNEAGFQGKLARGVQSKMAASLKPKDLCGIPWRVAFALQFDGWYLRQDIIWHKPNPMPESVTDRCTKAHEYIFLLAKSQKYYFDNAAIKEPTSTKDNIKRDRDTTRLNNVPGRSRMEGLKTNNYDTRNKRSVWTVTTKPFKGAHFATFPEDLIKPCILAGCPEGGVTLDPFMGSGTVGLVCEKLNRGWVGLELNKKYCEIAVKRVKSEADQIKLF